MPEKMIVIDKFLGTDNTSDATKMRFSGAGAFFRELLNIDIDDENMIHRRGGHSETPIVSGTDIHSFWSNDEIGLFVDGTNFKKVDTEYSVTTLITGLVPSQKISYVEAANRIYFGSMSIVGYIFKGSSYSFPDPNQIFKTKMVGGQLLEFFNSRLYAANDRNLFYSDATVHTRMDNRKNAIAFEGRISMVKAVSDGMYVSSNNKTYFMNGSDPSDFRITQVLDEAAIEGSAISVDGDDLGRGVSGRAIYFMVPSGVYKGYPGGVLVERQGGLFGLEDDTEIATSILREDKGYRQYVAIYRLISGKGGASGEIRLPRITAVGSGS